MRCSFHYFIHFIIFIFIWNICLSHFASYHSFNFLLGTSGTHFNSVFISAKRVSFHYVICLSYSIACVFKYDLLTTQGNRTRLLITSIAQFSMWETDVVCITYNIYMSWPNHATREGITKGSLHWGRSASGYKGWYAQVWVYK